MVRSAADGSSVRPTTAPCWLPHYLAFLIATGQPRMQLNVDPRWTRPHRWFPHQRILNVPAMDLLRQELTLHLQEFLPCKKALLQHTIKLHQLVGGAEGALGGCIRTGRGQALG